MKAVALFWLPLVVPSPWIEPPGWLARLVAWLSTWLWRVFVFVVIFGIGYGCRALTGGNTAPRGGTTAGTPPR